MLWLKDDYPETAPFIKEDSDGNWLLVANQESDNVIVFKRNITNGELINTGNSIKVSMPVCLLFY
jgi:6-phosphogluconolactonase (cycloisomerase 2 family)